MATSHRQIVRSSAIVGAASLVTIVLGIARLKVAALIVGPIGIGLIGLYLNFVTTVATLAGLGLNASAVREIAAANAAGDNELVDSNRRALLWATALAAAIVGSALILLREPIARTFLQGGLANAVPGLVVAAIFAAFSTVCLVLLNGFRQIAALSWMQVGGALAGTIAGLVALWLYRDDGILPYVILVHLSALLVGVVLVLRLRRPASPPRLPIIRSQGRKMVALGLSFMLSTFALSLAVLVIRSTIHDHLGGVALGQFAAAWMISSIYVGFVLQAMGTDFYPRLSEVAEDRATAGRLISEQVETAILLATPLLLLTIGLAPLVLQLAYAEAFKPAAGLLRWQILGDFFKIMAWPLAMFLLAARRGRTYLVVEVAAALSFALLVAFGIGSFGLDAAGIGYCIMYAGYFAVLLALTGISFHSTIVQICLAAGALALIVFALAMVSELAGTIAGLAGSVASGLWALRRLRQLGALPERIERLFSPRGPWAPPAEGS